MRRVQSRALMMCALLAAAPCFAQGVPVPNEPQAGSEREVRVQKSPAPTVSRPLWELGLGVGGLTLPDYRGSDNQSTYLLPIPYVVYRGDFFRADKNGARAVFVEADRVEMNLSVNASPPVRNKNRGARAGMDNLPASFEIGPNVNIMLWRSPSQTSRLDLRLPVRTAITLQHSPHAIGTVFAPQLNWDQANVFGGWGVGLQTGPLFATRRYHQHFYGVDAADATPTRPVYRAHGGYAGWNALAATSRRIGNTWYGAFIRYDTLAGATFADSPLVRQRHSLMAGFGVSWVFLQSDRRVDVPLEP